MSTAPVRWASIGLPFELLSCRNAGSFRDGVELSRRDVLHFVRHATWPLDDQPLGLRSRAQTEGYGKLGLRQIARPGFHDAPELVGAYEQANARANPVPVRLHPSHANADRVSPGCDVVAIEVCRSAIGRNDDVGIAVVVEISEGGAATNFRPDEIAADLRRDVRELAAS